MMRSRLVWLAGVAAMLACGVARAEDAGQAALDKATEIKLSAESAADLNQVVELCQTALKAGLDEANTKFAKEILASTLAQRAELMCLELFERPVTPNRGRTLVELALADLEETLKIDPAQVQPQYLLGRLYAHLGETEKGLKALDQAVALSQDEPSMHAKALLIRANLKTDMAAREADYDAAVKAMPHDANTLRFRGLFQLTQNHFDLAIADLSAAIAIEPEDADTYEARGVAQSLAQKYDDALVSFTKAIELAPDSPAAFTHRSRVRAIQGDSQAALADVDEALRLQPGSVQALLLRGTLLGTVGKFEEALADFDVLRKAMPDNPEILLQVAILYQSSKQPQKAVGAYDELLRADQKNAAVYRGRADAYLSLGKQGEAIADYQEAVKLDPKNSGVLNNLAWVLATSPEQSLRNGKLAIELAKQACAETEYKQAHILSTLAASYAETGDFETAITWSRKAVELGADSLKAQLTKELDSYQAKQPWREAAPPADEPAPTAKPVSPANEDTARSKPGN